MIIDRDRVALALPGYGLGEQLGSGAYGLVLAGTHRQMGRPVAIKVMEATGTAAAAGFAAEAHMLAKLDHPHIVRIYDYVEDHGLCMVVMELLAGGTLTRRRAAMRHEQICAVALAAAAALEHAHQHKVLHRDIKADNVMFAQDGTLKVTDFGVAKLFEGTGTTTTGIAGTPAYMAPEQIEGGQLGPWTDLYALGVVLYSLFTNRLPFDPKLPLLTLLSQQLTERPAPMPGVAAPLANVVHRLLAKSPADRPQDAATFALELAVAATTVFGVGWTTRGQLPLYLDDAVRAATDRAPGSAVHWDFFLSYASADQEWANWIAWELEAAGYQVLLQTQGGAAGSRWTADPPDGVQHCARTLVLLSGAYLGSVFEETGWGAAQGTEAEYLARALMPVRLEDCPVPDLPGAAPALDLFGYSAETARKALLDRAAVALAGRTEPSTPGALSSFPPTVTTNRPATLVPPQLPAAPVAPSFPAAPQFPPPPEGSLAPVAESDLPTSDLRAFGASGLPAEVVPDSARSEPGAGVLPGGARPPADGPGGRRPADSPHGPRNTRRRRPGSAWIVGAVVLVLLVAAGLLALSLRPTTTPSPPTAHQSAAVSAPTTPSAGTAPSTSPGGSVAVSPPVRTTVPPSSGITTPAASSAATTRAAESAAPRSGANPTAYSIKGVNGNEDPNQVPGSEADTSWMANDAACSAWLDDNGSGSLAGVLNTSLYQSCGAELYRSDGMAYTFSASWGAMKTNFIPVGGYSMWICVWNTSDRSGTQACSSRFGMNGTTPVRQ
jgi:hypothetical protein